MSLECELAAFHRRNCVRVMSVIQHGELEKVRLQLRAIVLPRPPDVIEVAISNGGYGALSRELNRESSGIEQATHAALARAAVGLPLGSGELRSLIRRALSLWTEDFFDPATPLHWQGGLDTDPHDCYFRIERSAAPSTHDYPRAVLSGLELFLQEVASPDELRDYQCIGLELLDLWCSAFGSTQPVPRMTTLGAMHQRAPNPVRRWVRGHQIFAVITQGLIWTLHRFEQASLADEEAALRESLQRMAQLYHASAAAFRFTADFDPAFYEHSIRPSMSEPHMPSGFSGTMSTDHGHLVSRLKVLRAPLAAARARCPLEYDAMTAALAQVYEDHKWVCARFTGASSTSLLTGSLSGDRSAVEMLDRFKARRVGNLLA